MSGVWVLLTREGRFLDGYEKNVLVSFSYKKHSVQQTKRTSSSKGVGILFNNNFNFQIIKYKADVNGRFIIVDIKIKKAIVHKCKHIRP